MNNSQLTGRDDRDSLDASPRKRRRGLWWVSKWSAVLFALMVVGLILMNIRMYPGPNSPLVRVSPETTWVTGPLKPNGDVDYVAYLNQSRAKGVAPQNNAAVDLIRIWGPVVEQKPVPREVFELLGIDPLPVAGDYLRGFDWGYGEESEVSATFDGQIVSGMYLEDLLGRIPVGPGQVPEADLWLQENEKHMLAIREAVRKEHFFVPSVGPDVLDVNPVFREAMWSMGCCLRQSSMMRLGRGDMDGAIDDALAILRLGRHGANRGLLSEYLVAIRIESQGHETLARILVSDKCSSEQLDRISRELELLPPMPILNQSHLDAERALMLDITYSHGRGRRKTSQQTESTTGGSQKLSTSSWEATFRHVNEAYDELENALKLPDPGDRSAELGQCLEHLESRASERYTLSGWSRMLLNGRVVRGEMIGDEILSVCLPAMVQVEGASHRVIAINNMTRVLVGIYRFKKQHGKLPVQLDAIVPEFLAKLPVDPFSESGFFYRINEDDSFALYSIGPNRRDDGGADMNDVPYAECDLSAVPKIRTIQQLLESFEAENN